MKVSIKEIAEKTGFSPATVSLALNGSELVKDSTRKIIKKTATEMGYTPNPYARKLVLQKSGMLGLIVPTLRNVYYADLVHFINDIVRKKGYGLIISASDNTPATEQKILGEMLENQVEGIMLAPVNLPNDQPEYVSGLPVPLVFTTAKYKYCEFPCVMCDLKQGMYDITRNVIEKGRRRIAFVTGAEGVDALDLREAGFLAAAKQHADYRIFRVHKLGFSSGCQAAGDLVKSRCEFDTVLCVDDMMASGMINTLMTAGVSVPGQVWVTGFDSNIFSKICTVPITTVRQDIEQIALNTVELMLDMIQSGNNGRDITIPCTIVPRNSAW